AMLGRNNAAVKAIPALRRTGYIEAMKPESGAEKVAAVIVAAGRGIRAGTGLPKQYRPLGGQPVIRRSLRALATHPALALVQPVIHSDDRKLFEEAAAGLPLLSPVSGGNTRQESVLA